MMAAEDSPDMLAAALALAEMGFSVFPCHTPRPDGRCSCGAPLCNVSQPGNRVGKHPRTQHGLKDASAVPAVIREWWRKWPDANIGLVTGSGLVVLDVDVHKDGSSAGLDLPATLRVVTGSGGEHWYLSAAEAVANSVCLVGPGLDVRGDGGYVLAPPSLHACGRRYAWDAGSEATIAPAPAWFLRLANAKRAATALPGSPDAFVAGGRNDALFAWGCSMRRKGFGIPAITVALLEENAARCRPPIDEDEVRRIAKSAERYEPEDPVSPKSEWVVLTGADLASKLPPIAWLCRELGIAPGAATLLAGSNYSGKTMISQALAVSVATGLPLWGRFKVESGAVLHVDYEQGRHVTQIRYQRLALTRGVWYGIWDNLGVVTLPPAHLDAEGSLAKLEALCVGRKLCVIDSLKAAFPSADENSSDVRKWLDALLPISERTGCVFVVIHHTRKPHKDAVGGTKANIRGSSAISDACGSIFSIVDTERKGQRMFYHEKARLTGRQIDAITLTISDVSIPVEQFPADIAEATRVDLASNHSGTLRHGLEVVAADVDLSLTIAGRIVSFVSKHEGCSVQEIRLGVVGRGTEISATLAGLIRSGHIVERIGWRNKRIHLVGAPDHDPED